MSSAVDTYIKAGVDPAGQHFHVWSFSADDEVKLRNSGSITSRSDGLLISSADLAALGIHYEAESIPLGDVAALATWIFKQDRFGRTWTIPVWCSEPVTGLADRDTSSVTGSAL